jgi:predicted nucleic acid-binding protein
MCWPLCTGRHSACWQVLCELQEGIVFTADPGHYGRTLKAVMKEMGIWPLDWNLVAQYGSCAKIARERGRVLSTTDLIHAAFAWKERVVLLTADKDFEAFPEIKTENWIVDA